MTGKNRSGIVKRIIDFCMTAALLLLMAYQVTGEVLHEWIGISMTILVIIHQILNRRWYSAVFKGKYNHYRILTTMVNTLLILFFILTALSGMSMSSHAVPFLYGIINVYYSKLLHILHIPVMTANLKLTGSQKTALSCFFCLIAGIGLFLFIRDGRFDYMFFDAVFASFDYNKSGLLVVLENVVMLLFWGFIGAQLSNLCRKTTGNPEQKKQMFSICYIITAVIIGQGMNMIIN